MYTLSIWMLNNITEDWQWPTQTQENLEKEIWTLTTDKKTNPVAVQNCTREKNSK